jgi:hypothetical protein
MGGWYDEKERYAVDSSGREQIIQHEREHCGAFLLSRYDLVQVSDHYVHFAFVEVADVLSVPIRQVSNRDCFNAFGCKFRQEERVGSFEISNYCGFYKHMNGLGSMLRKGLRQVVEDAKARAVVTGYGSMTKLHLLKDDVRKIDLKSLVTNADIQRENSYFHHLTSVGILPMIPTQVHFYISLPHKKEEIDRTITATEEFFLKSSR